MCGIVGEVTWGSSEPAELTSAVRCLEHRGPDDWGVWRGERCALGHTRLAVIDPTRDGRQPMLSPDGRYVVTFNGEIYNFASLREELAQDGYRFHGRSDTEVLVAAVVKWGREAVHRFEGMFAFAVWDSAERRLLVVRDRVGKKPLFYALDGHRFRFASEVQALVADGAIERRASPEAIDSYLTWGYVPAPLTALAGVSKLPPGHWLEVDASGRTPRVTVRQWWTLPYEPKLQIGRDEATAEVRRLVTEAVSQRLVSDVPLGAFLSGGVDSSIIVGVMAGLSSRPVKTFSIGFADPRYNELDHARRIAERYGTDHHEEVVDPDVAEILPRLVRHFGEPFADSSAVPTYVVAHLARRHVTVALSGDGGDELFGGYDRYRALAMSARLTNVPGVGRVAGLLAGRLPADRDVRTGVARARRFLEALGDPPARRYGRWVGLLAPETKRALYGPVLRPTLEADLAGAWLDERFGEAGVRDARDAAMAFDVATYLPGDLLTKTDISTMANSLEARCPFLDVRLMELVARLPADWKVGPRGGKALLNDAFADVVPEENRNRPKMGFGVPIGDWLRGRLRPLLEDTVLDSTALDRGYFEADAVRGMVDDHVRGRVDRAHELWALLMLELWHRELQVGPPA